MSLDVGPALRAMRRQPAVLALVVLEIAAGVTTISALLISAHWYGRIGETSSGIDERDLVLITLHSPRLEVADEAADQAEIAERRSDKQRAVDTAGVTGASLLSSSILEDRWSYPNLFGASRASGTPTTQTAVGWGVYADVDLARVTGLHFVSGTIPSETGVDRPTGAVLTRCLADSLFGAGHASVAVGARLSSPMALDVPITGVVDDVFMRTPFLPRARCVAFLFGGQPRDHEARLIVRAKPGLRATVIEDLRRRFAGARPSRVVAIRAFDSKVSVHHRVGSGLIRMLSFFGIMVGIVALVGSLAATSFLVAQRNRQIGVRRALGATKANIVGYFLVESALAVFMGSLLGVIATAALFTLMRQVFTDMIFDTRLIAATLLATWVATVVATLVPALRAARVPPSVASRSL